MQMPPCPNATQFRVATPVRRTHLRNQHIPARERVVVALSGDAEGQTLIRRAARIAARCGADLLAVHITRPGGRTAALTARLVTQRQLTESLGGTYHQLTSDDTDDIAAALLAFVRADNATQLVLGMGQRSWLSAVRPKGRIISRVIRGSTGTDVHIVSPGDGALQAESVKFSRSCGLQAQPRAADTPLPHSVKQPPCRMDDQVRPPYQKLPDPFSPSAF
jgi:K+-sensing histidine kinase KdpD